MCYAPGRIRTCDPQLRRLLLYPAELRARSLKASVGISSRPGELGDKKPPAGRGVKT
jgi:hypothetical protein